MTLSTMNSVKANVVADIDVVSNYFEAFNQEDYDSLVDLFADEGALNAPFEEPIVGHEKIRAYLQQEAAGMRATPKQFEENWLEDGTRQILVKGRVKAMVFTVNVGWTFLISNDGKILEATIKLLASMQDLMKINQGKG
jgi:ketosteroid isomerase-like protein